MTTMSDRRTPGSVTLHRRAPCRTHGRRARPFGRMAVCLLLALAGSAASFAQVGALAATGSVVDARNVPGPAGVAVVRKPSATLVLTVSYTENRLLSNRVASDGTLAPVDSKPTGAGPRAVAITRQGGYAVTVNSDSDDMSVHAIDDNGFLTQVGPRVPSGGDNPFDVAAVFDDLVVVANRDSDTVSVFSLDSNGNMRKVGNPSPTGVDPHVVAISPRGLVAVANSTSNDLTIFEIDQQGNMFLADESFPVGNSPKAVAFDKRGGALFVATGGATPGVEYQIQGYRVARPGARQVDLVPESVTPGGYFVTDMKMGQRHLHVATVGATQGNELRAYDVDGTSLHPDGTFALPGPPSFKQLAAARGASKSRENVFVTEYQANQLLLFRFD